MKQKYKHVKKGGYIRICKIYTNLTVNNKNEVNSLHSSLDYGLFLVYA